MGARAAAAAGGAVSSPDPINEALRLYTAYGRASFPRARTGDLAAAFGAPAAAELKGRILALYDELQQPLPEPDRKAGRKSATERAIEHLAGRHPELDENGLAVLAWAFSFGLR